MKNMKRNCSELFLMYYKVLRCIIIKAMMFENIKRLNISCKSFHGKVESNLMYRNCVGGIDMKITNHS